jgi:hypothetical protein
VRGISVGKPVEATTMTAMMQAHPSKKYASLLSLAISTRATKILLVHLLDLKRSSLGDTQKDLGLVPELCETSLGPLSLGFESVGDLSNFGLHTSVEDDDSCSTLGDLRSGENKADSVTI